MIFPRLAKCSKVLLGLLSLAVLSPSVRAQITVEGKVLDSKNGPVGGVDVAIYVVGNKDPINSQKSDPKTGEYHFFKLELAGAFDIMYTHTMYETATVSRLAEQDNQHVSKVIYRKGEPRPLTAVHEQFTSARRLILLANALERKSDRDEFNERLTKIGVWEGLHRNLDEMVNEKLSDRMRMLLETEQYQVLTLRQMLQILDRHSGL